MKKSVRISILFTALFLSLTICRDVVAQINVGVKAGVNISNFRPNPIAYKPKSGLNAALLLNVPLSRYFSLQMEPGFSQRGAKIDIDAVWVTGNPVRKNQILGEINLGYFELPLLFQYKPKIGKLEGIVSIGPELRFRLGPQTVNATTREYENGVLVSETTTKYDLKQPNGYRPFDYGLTGGAGIAYPLPFGRIFTEARYHLGLRKMSSNVEFHNRGIYIHVGVLIPVKK